MHTRTRKKRVTIPFMIRQEHYYLYKQDRSPGYPYYYFIPTKSLIIVRTDKSHPKKKKKKSTI